MSDTIQIGITECGDPGINPTWKNNLSSVNGAILITKHITDRLINEILTEQKHKPISIHATVTGWGGTKIEPNVPDYKEQLSQLRKLIDSGFPEHRATIRIDPIIPSEDGLIRMTTVLNEAIKLNLLPGIRVRISVMDNYKHVIDRFIKNGIQPLYNNKWNAPTEAFDKIVKTLEPYGKMGIVFETCAEPMLSHKVDYIIENGCLSNKDLQNMGLPTIANPSKCSQRSTCTCLGGIKKQLIMQFTPCAHGCLYCYWKDKK